MTIESALESHAILGSPRVFLCLGIMLATGGFERVFLTGAGIKYLFWLAMLTLLLFIRLHT